MRGKKTGGRKRGKANKLTNEAREAFRMVYEGRLKDLDRWVTETGDGFQCEKPTSEGGIVTYTEKNPSKAADLLLRMAEHFIPKLTRSEHTGKDGEPIESRTEVKSEPPDRERVAQILDVLQIAGAIPRPGPLQQAGSDGGATEDEVLGAQPTPDPAGVPAP